MKALFAILLAALCAITAHAQTIKSLSYNTSNDTVVATQRITFPLLGVASGTAATPSLTYVSGTNLFGTFGGTALGVGPYLGFSVDGTRRFYISTNDIRFELPVSFNSTNNAATTRTNLSLGAAWLTNTDATNFRTAIGLGATNDVSFNSVAVTNADQTRTNLGIPLPALTNTSNVTMMRALAGQTNTNTPASGTYQITNIVSLIISNGIIVQVEVP